MAAKKSSTALAHAESKNPATIEIHPGILNTLLDDVTSYTGENRELDRALTTVTVPKSLVPALVVRLSTIVGASDEFDPQDVSRAAVMLCRLTRAGTVSPSELESSVSGAVSWGWNQVKPSRGE